MCSTLQIHGRKIPFSALSFSLSLHKTRLILIDSINQRSILKNSAFTAFESKCQSNCKVSHLEIWLLLFVIHSAKKAISGFDRIIRLKRDSHFFFF